jgi:hypothetical protein
VTQEVPVQVDVASLTRPQRREAGDSRRGSASTPASREREAGELLLQQLVLERAAREALDPWMPELTTARARAPRAGGRRGPSSSPHGPRATTGRGTSAAPQASAATKKHRRASP